MHIIVMYGVSVAIGNTAQFAEALEAEMKEDTQEGTKKEGDSSQ